MRSSSSSNIIFTSNTRTAIGTCTMYYVLCTPMYYVRCMYLCGNVQVRNSPSWLVEKVTKLQTTLCEFAFQKTGLFDYEVLCTMHSYIVLQLWSNTATGTSYEPRTIHSTCVYLRGLVCVTSYVCTVLVLCTSTSYYCVLDICRYDACA